MVELKEEEKILDELLEQAIERGCVTADDILMAFPEAEENLASLKTSLTTSMSTALRSTRTQQKLATSKPGKCRR